MTLEHHAHEPLPVVAPMLPIEWVALRQQAEVLVASGLCPRHLRGKVDDVLVIGMVARELALPLMTAVNKITVIEGRPTMAAELMAALILRAGHQYRMIEQSSTRAAISVHRADWPADRWDLYEFTIDDADAAELTAYWYERKVENEYGGKRTERFLVDDKGRPLRGVQQLPEWVLKQKDKGIAPRRNDPWHNYRKAMLWARCVSLTARSAFPDVMCGVSYVPEELGATVDPDTGEIVYVGEETDQSLPPLSDDLPLQEGDPTADAEMGVADGKRYLHRLVWRQYDRAKRNPEALKDVIRDDARARWVAAELPDNPDDDGGRPVVITGSDVFAAFKGEKPPASEAPDDGDVTDVEVLPDDEDAAWVAQAEAPVCSGWIVTDTAGTRWEHEPPDADVPVRECPVHGTTLVVHEEATTAPIVVEVGDEFVTDPVTGEVEVRHPAGARR